MAELIKETITTQGPTVDPVIATPVRIGATSSQTVEYLVYFFFGALEILLAFRLVLKLAGANIYSAFVGLVYGITGVFILPFEGIFRRGITRVADTTSVFEASTLVAIIVYSVLAWGIVRLVRVLSGEQQSA